MLHMTDRQEVFREPHRNTAREQHLGDGLKVATLFSLSLIRLFPPPVEIGGFVSAHKALSSPWVFVLTLIRLLNESVDLHLICFRFNVFFMCLGCSCFHRERESECVGCVCVCQFNLVLGEKEIARGGRGN